MKCNFMSYTPIHIYLPCYGFFFWYFHNSRILPMITEEKEWQRRNIHEYRIFISGQGSQTLWMLKDVPTEYLTVLKM